MRSIVLFSLILTLSALAWQATAGDKASSTPNLDNAPPAQRAFMDVQTGQLVAPTRQQRQAMQQQSLDGTVSGVAQQITEVIQRDGLTIITIPPSLWPVEQVVIDDQGKLSAAGTEQTGD